MGERIKLDDILRSAANLRDLAHPSQVQLTIAGIDDVIDMLKETKSVLISGTVEPEAYYATLTRNVSAKIEQIVAKSREKHVKVNQLGLKLEEFFKNAPTAYNSPLCAVTGNEMDVSKAICRHLVREGLFDIAKEYSSALNLKDKIEVQEQQLGEMNMIIEDLRQLNTELAREWVAENLVMVKRYDETINFDLHKLQFLKMLLQLKETRYDNATCLKRMKEVLKFAQDHLASTQIRIDEVRRLVCSLLYLGTENMGPFNPYYREFNICRETLVTFSDQLIFRFERLYCSVNGSSPDSPVRTVYNVGVTALPIILKSFGYLKRVRDWTAESELHVEIPLLKTQRFHSVFTCPVLRSQTSEANPPVMLPCGHVISNTALQRILRGANTDFRCPYCPQEANQSQVVFIKF